MTLPERKNAGRKDRADDTRTVSDLVYDGTLKDESEKSESGMCLRPSLVLHAERYPEAGSVLVPRDYKIHNEAGEGR